MADIKYDKFGVPTIGNIRAHLAHRQAIGRVGRNVEDGFCEYHEREELGYHANYERDMRLMESGQRQTRCGNPPIFNGAYQ